MSDQEETALVKPQGNDPVRALSRYLDARQKNLAKFAASRIKPETLVRLALFQFSQDEWLRKCTPESIYAALVLSAQIGLEPSGVRGEAYLIPFRGRCTLIPGWRGLIKLALQSKAVKQIYSYVVYEGDIFRVFLGSNPHVEHEPALENRGEIIACYAIAHLENGSQDVEVMTIDELEKIRDNAAKSRGGKDGPAYQEWASEMYRKAPIRRLCKRLPLGDDFFKAMKADEFAEAGEPEKINSFIDVDVVDANPPPVTDSVGDKLAERAAKVREG